MEMALFCAISAARGGKYLNCAPSISDPVPAEASIEICGLVDPKDNLDAAVLQSKQLVAQGFNTLKIKVARGLAPEDDGRLIAAVRSAVGNHVNLRCDANRGWSLHQAITFAGALDGTEIEYVEEPLDQFNQIQDFFRATGLKCALDETLIESTRKGFFNLSNLTIEGIVTWVVKPSLLGSLDLLIDLAEQSKQSGINLVISSVFESSLGLSFLGNLAYRVNEITNRSPAHGLGTAAWFQADVVDWEVCKMHRSILLQPFIALEDLGMVLDSTTFDSCRNGNVVGNVSQMENMTSSFQECGDNSFCVSHAHMPAVESSSGGPLVYQSPLVVFIHGFMGSKADWEPIIDQLGGDHHCLAVDLPGHGCTSWSNLRSCTIKSVASALLTSLEKMGAEKCIIIGYSLGARIALQMAALSSDRSVRIVKVVSISGSAGILDSAQRQARTMQDSKLATKLEMHGFESFVNHWYQGSLWTGLRQRPGLLQKVLLRRKNSNLLHTNGCTPRKLEEQLGTVLSSLSTGKMVSSFSICDTSGS